MRIHVFRRQYRLITLVALLMASTPAFALDAAEIRIERAIDMAPMGNVNR